MVNTRTYIVTLKSKEELREFYDEMENYCPIDFIPHREVSCVNRRPISRNTYYELTDVEAEGLKEDIRIKAIELTPKERGLKIRPFYTQHSDYWSKAVTNNSSHNNWGLLRCVEGVQRSNWGSDNIANQTGDIRLTNEGRNVDVVIVDGHINPSHPEYAVNSDGSGGTRVDQFNWLSLNPIVTGQPTGTYVYTPYTGGADERENNHGAHVAGTVAGNTQGWARSANIFNLSPYSSNPNVISADVLIDYIRVFHTTKSINSQTGYKNPTITNHSWGFASQLDISLITSVNFRGSTYTGPFTETQLNSYGIHTELIEGTVYAIRPARVAAIDADIEDAIDEGVLFVGAAGNDYTKIDIESGTDYANYFIWDGYTVPYHKGSSPGSAPGMLCVGAISSLANETKAVFSNCGPRVDVYAPGYSIQSSFNNTASFGGVSDPRNSSYFIGKISGTSMASPQTCGLLACVLETYPNMTQSQLLDYLRNISKVGQITDTAGDVTDYTSLQGSDNLYLAHKQERVTTGSVYPKQDYFIRPVINQVYPRTQLRRY